MYEMTGSQLPQQKTFPADTLQGCAGSTPYSPITRESCRGALGQRRGNPPMLGWHPMLKYWKQNLFVFPRCWCPWQALLFLCAFWVLVLIASPCSSWKQALNMSPIFPTWCLASLLILWCFQVRHEKWKIRHSKIFLYTEINEISLNYSIIDKDLWR